MFITNTRVYGLNESIIRSKYPKNDIVTDNAAKYVLDDVITKTDISRATKLGQCANGTGHDNFLKGIIVQFDLNMSLKAWPQAQRYHWFDIVSSCSTMHTIHKMDIKEHCNEYVWPETIDMLQRAIDQYNEHNSKLNDNSLSGDIKASLQRVRDKLFYNIVYNIPMGFELTAGITTNYQQLKTIYKQRRNHRLPEWQMICDWIESLSCSFLITGKKE